VAVSNIRPSYIIIFHELQLGYQSFSNMISILLLTTKLKYIWTKYI